MIYVSNDLMGIWSIVHSSISYQYNHRAIKWSEKRKGKRTLNIFSIVSRSDQISSAITVVPSSITNKETVLTLHKKINLAT